MIGGAALPKALAKAGDDRGIDIFAGYGMSESCPILTLGQLRSTMLDRWTDAETQLAHQGRIAGPAGRPAHRGRRDERRPSATARTSGEIVVRAPWLTKGTSRIRRLRSSSGRGGYLHTGDIGTIDRRRHLQITDRLKDVIKTGGEWISSLELEDIMLQHAGLERGRGHRREGRQMGRAANRCDRPQDRSRR